MLTLIVFIAILSFLVFVHELGHFVMAKRAGVRVEEFGIGMPPRIFGKKVGETLYSINLLPLGGFVKLTGEDLEGATVKEAMADHKNFLSKKASVRAGILVAGVVMNLLFAFIFYQTLLMLNGYKSPTIPLYLDYKFRFGEENMINTVVIGLEQGSPAGNAQIKPGEAIIEVNDVPVYSIEDVIANVSPRSDLPTKILLMDVRSSDRKTRAITVTPVKNTEGKVQIGVMLGPVVSIHYDKRVERIFGGAMHGYNMFAYSTKILSTLVGASISTRSVGPVSSSVSGPVGIFSVVGEVLTSKGKDVVLSLLDLMGLLSLSLGVMNLLPIPALDGGRLAFVVAEMISGKRLHPSREAFIHKVGMVFLLALIALVTLKDVRNLIK